MLDAMWRAIDLVLRFVFVVAAPIMLVPLAVVFPITGTLVGAGIATLVALIGTDRIKRIPYVGRVLGGMGKLGDFYREHPPKPLVYYIFYPLLLPVILFMKIPRREFLLYRKLNVIALAVVIISGALDYFRHWRPELTFGQFVAAMIMTLVLQLLATFALVMPIVTTLMHLRTRAYTKTLVALLVLAALSAVGGALSVHKMHGGMQISTWMRIKERTKVGFATMRQCMSVPHSDARACLKQNHALVAIVDALDQVYVALQIHPTDLDGALDRAHDKLEDYYKPDEAKSFKLYAGEGVYILFVEYGSHERIWIGRDAHKLLWDVAELPPGAHKAMHLKKK